LPKRSKRSKLHFAPPEEDCETQRVAADPKDWLGADALRYVSADAGTRNVTGVELNAVTAAVAETQTKAKLTRTQRMGLR